MKWESIQSNWQTANESADDSQVERLTNSARDRDRDLHRTVRRRDLIETSVALLMVPFFGIFTWIALNKGMWITAAASALLVGCCLYVPWRLRQARKLLPDPEMSTDMMVYLKAERVATQAQYELLKGVLAWYLGPIGVGVSLFYFGAQGWSLNTLYYTLAVLAVYGAIYMGNQRVATRQIAPRIAQIDEQIRELNRGDLL